MNEPSWPLWAVRGGAVLGLLLSGLLLYESLTKGGVPGCAPGSSCDTVLASRWSQVFGVPVSAGALVLYVVMLAASLHAGPGGPGATAARRRVAWVTLLFCGAVAAAAAVWFMGLQAVVIGAFCKYCTAAHVVGGLTAIAAWVGAARVGATGRAVRTVAAAVLIVAGLGVGQAFGPYRSQQVVRISGTGYVDAGSGPERKVGLMNGAVMLAPHTLPIVGSADAPLVVAELMDYTCPHCREMHHQLDAVRAGVGVEYAVLPLPAPLDEDCNPLVQPGTQNPLHATACELATLALAVYRADAAWFEPYHRWLMQGEAPPTPEAARARAVELVGEERLAAAERDAWPREQIGRNIKLYELTPGSLPILLMPTSVAIGKPDSEGELLALLRAEATAVQQAGSATKPSPSE